MAAKYRTYSTHHVVALLALLCPLLLGYFNYLSRESKNDLSYNKPHLTGIVISDKKEELTSESWFSGTYQNNAEDYNNDHWALKELMVRWNNQFYYTTFNQIRVNGFVMGKEDFVFSEGYIFSAFGDDLVDEAKIKEQMRKLKVIQDTLKKKDIDIVLGLVPGKGAYYKEYVEDKYKHAAKTTNHANYLKYADASGINVIDLYSTFLKLKSQSPYPLFTKFGHHWSYYGECIASQMLIKYVENLRHENLPDILWDTIEVIDSAKVRDADILKSMNLVFNPPQNMTLAYPKVYFESDSLKSKTRMLVIGDSYWYGPVYTGVPQYCFNAGEFWYYFNRVVPTRETGVNLEAWELDLKQEVEQNKVIALLYSDANLRGLGNGFIEDVYELYTSPKTYYERSERNKKIQGYAKQIRNTPALLKKATIQSNEMQTPLDSVIRTEAWRMAGG